MYTTRQFVSDPNSSTLFTGTDRSVHTRQNSRVTQPMNYTTGGVFSDTDRSYNTRPSLLNNNNGQGYSSLYNSNNDDILTSSETRKYSIPGTPNTLQRDPSAAADLPYNQFTPTNHNQHDDQPRLPNLNELRADESTQSVQSQLNEYNNTYTRQQSDSTLQRQESIPIWIDLQQQRQAEEEQQYHNSTVESTPHNTESQLYDFTKTKTLDEPSQYTTYVDTNTSQSTTSGIKSKHVALIGIISCLVSVVSVVRLLFGQLSGMSLSSMLGLWTATTVLAGGLVVVHNTLEQNAEPDEIIEYEQPQQQQQQQIQYPTRVQAPVVQQSYIPKQQSYTSQQYISPQQQVQQTQQRQQSQHLERQQSNEPRVRTVDEILAAKGIQDTAEVAALPAAAVALGKYYNFEQRANSADVRPQLYYDGEKQPVREYNGDEAIYSLDNERNTAELNNQTQYVQQQAPAVPPRVVEPANRVDLTQTPTHVQQPVQPHSNDSSYTSTALAAILAKDALFTDKYVQSAAGQNVTQNAPVRVLETVTHSNNNAQYEPIRINDNAEPSMESNGITVTDITPSQRDEDGFVSAVRAPSTSPLTINNSSENRVVEMLSTQGELDTSKIESQLQPSATPDMLDTPANSIQSLSTISSRQVSQRNGIDTGILAGTVAAGAVALHHNNTTEYPPLSEQIRNIPTIPEVLEHKSPAVSQYNTATEPMITEVTQSRPIVTVTEPTITTVSSESTLNPAQSPIYDADDEKELIVNKPVTFVRPITQNEPLTSTSPVQEPVVETYQPSSSTLAAAAAGAAVLGSLAVHHNNQQNQQQPSEPTPLVTQVENVELPRNGSDRRASTPQKPTFSSDSIQQLNQSRSPEPQTVQQNVQQSKPVQNIPRVLTIDEVLERRRNAAKQSTPTSTNTEEQPRLPNLNMIRTQQPTQTVQSAPSTSTLEAAAAGAAVLGTLAANHTKQSNAQQQSAPSVTQIESIEPTKQYEAVQEPTPVRQLETAVISAPVQSVQQISEPLQQYNNTIEPVQVTYTVPVKQLEPIAPVIPAVQSSVSQRAKQWDSFIQQKSIPTVQSEPVKQFDTVQPIWQQQPTETKTATPMYPFVHNTEMPKPVPEPIPVAVPHPVLEQQPAKMTQAELPRHVREELKKNKNELPRHVRKELFGDDTCIPSTKCL